MLFFWPSLFLLLVCLLCPILFYCLFVLLCVCVCVLGGLVDYSLSNYSGGKKGLDLVGWG